MERTIIWIAHVPYEHRGGEDTHVETLQKAYSNLNCEVVFLPQDRTAQNSTFWSAAKSLLMTNGNNEWDEFFKIKKPKLIHIHNAFPQLGPAFFRWAQNKKIPVVMTVHNHRFFCTNGLALRDGINCKDCFSDTVALKPLLHNCNHSMSKTAYHSIALTEMRTKKLYKNVVQKFIAPSPYIQAELIRWGIDENKITHILNPISFVSSNSNTNAKYDVFFAGRFSQEKGIHELLEVIEYRLDLKFLLAGTGPLESFVLEKAEKLKNLTVLSKISTEEVHAYIQSSRVGILTSLCNEILPTFVLEVLAHGKPCVVAQQESTQWLAKNPWNVVLTNPKNFKTLSRDIDRAMQAPHNSQDNVLEIKKLISIEKFQEQLMNNVISKYL